MAKKERLERDPSLDPRTGKKKERKNVDVKIDVDFSGASAHFEKMEEQLRKMMDSGINVFTQDAAGRLFGSGRVSFDSSGHTARILDMAEKLYGGGRMSDEEIESNIAKLLLKAAADAWDNVVGWNFTVGYNPGDVSFWLTASYYDDEAEEDLVKGTVELVPEDIKTGWDGMEEIASEKLSALHEKLSADLAAFEED